MGGKIGPSGVELENEIGVDKSEFWERGEAGKRGMGWNQGQQIGEEKWGAARRGKTKNDNGAEPRAKAEWKYGVSHQSVWKNYEVGEEKVVRPRSVRTKS